MTRSTLASFAALLGLLVLAACSAPSTPASTSTSSTAGTPATINPPVAVTARPKFAYVGNQGASLSGYSIDPSSGALTALPNFPLALGENPTALTHDPQNRFLFVSDIAAWTLDVFSINSTSGALTFLATYPTIKEPVSATVDPSGTHLFVTAQGSNQIAAYNIAASGALTLVPGSPFTTGKSAAPYSLGPSTILTNSAGTILFVQDYSSIYTWSISSSNAALTLLQTIPGPTFGEGLALDPNGDFLYAIGSASNSIWAFSIAPTTGLLTLAKTSPMAEQQGSYTISVSPSGQYAYTIENNNFLVSYSILNGAFTPVGPAYPGYFGLQIGIDPSGSFLYIPNPCSAACIPTLLENSVSEFAISTGPVRLLPNSPIPAGISPFGITFISQ